MTASAAPPTSGRFMHVAVLTLTVVVFATVVAIMTLQLRSGVQEQILRREADMLATIAAMQLDISAETIGEVPAAAIPATLILATLKTSTKLPGVKAVRMFDANRNFIVAWPLPWSQEPPTEAEWTRLQAGQSLAQLHAALSEQDVVGFGDTRRGLVEAWVPLRRSGSSNVIGAAEFWVDDTASVDELARHDQRLWVQAGVAWLFGSAVIVFAISWAFRRLGAANRALQARSEDLQRANRELVLAAKTSALGAVTAHLIHELKNPIAGLELIVAGQTEAGLRSETGGELVAASELTRRLRTMVNDVVGVLRDEQAGADFELTGAEVAEVALAKVQAFAAERAVRLESGPLPDFALPGRRANLAGLVLRNLLQNAIEAAGSGGSVRLSGRVTAGGMEFSVDDTGGGLPESVRTRLFQPCSSTKVGGSGLGLALSHQLAQQAGGRLELVRSDARGTSFRLVLTAEA